MILSPAPPREESEEVESANLFNLSEICSFASLGQAPIPNFDSTVLPPSVVAGELLKVAE